MYLEEIEIYKSLLLIFIELYKHPNVFHRCNWKDKLLIPFYVISYFS